MEAIESYESSLTVWSRKGAPQEWAKVQANMGRALVTLGRLENDKGYLQHAILAQSNAIEVFIRDKNTNALAVTLINRADARIALGERERGTKDFQQAVDDCNQALLVLSAERTPRYWKAAIKRREIAVEMLRGNNGPLESLHRQP